MDWRQAACIALIGAFGMGLGACDDFSRSPGAKAPAGAAQASAPPTSADARPTAGPALASEPASAATPGVDASASVTAPAAVPASADPEAAAIEVSAFGAADGPQGRRRLLIKLEVLLDRAHFSPGVIDGKPGANLKRALAAFQQARGLAGDGSVDGATIDALTAADSGPVTQNYVITAADEKGPFLGKLPVGFAEMAKLDHLGYVDPAQELAEKFHMDEGLLRALNPKADLSLAGTSIVVVRPGSSDLGAPVARVEVDKAANQLRALDAGGKLIAAFPATVGSTERPAPAGEWAVASVTANPNYTYDPSRLTFGPAAKGKLTIAPGPNNPVGSTWIALTKETYGIHGAPDPTRVGKTASHGCVRLTNWDAAALGRAVKKRTPVVFLGSEKDTPRRSP